MIYCPNFYPACLSASRCTSLIPTACSYTVYTCLSVYVCVRVHSSKHYSRTCVLRVHAYVSPQVCLYNRRSVCACMSMSVWGAPGDHSGRSARGHARSRASPKEARSSACTTVGSPCWAASALKKPWLTRTQVRYSTKSMLIKAFNSSWTSLTQSDVLNINLSSWGRGGGRRERWRSISMWLPLCVV